MKHKQTTNQRLLFDDCSTTCEAYSACGGYKSSAPCGCTWSLESGKRYQCHKCYLYCRERGSLNNEKKLKVNTFLSAIADGLTLDQVSIAQKKKTLSTYIPTLTHKYPSGNTFSGIVGVDISTIFSCRKNGGVSISKHFKTEELARKYLHVDNDCDLIAILNGFDWKLESFWHSSRIQLLKHLREIGFTSCTAPTFSITALTTEDTIVPFSHHIAMHMRHNRVLSEISRTGLHGIPNLYWIDNDSQQIIMWGKWLNENPAIHTISKEFTSAKSWNTIEERIAELIQILNMTPRKYHIMIIGTGQANASKVANMISSFGHTFSIVSSAPILKAVKGNKYIISNGKIVDSKSDDTRQNLVKHNIDIFKQSINKAI